jgi:hypothetical protein
VSKPPGGILTLVFADIEGSTRLLASLGSHMRRRLPIIASSYVTPFHPTTASRSTPKERLVLRLPACLRRPRRRACGPTSLGSGCPGLNYAQGTGGIDHPGVYEPRGF